MSFARDALYGLYGALRLARGDASGATYFDDTGDGALRSFRALFLVLPGFAAFQAMVYGQDLPGGFDLVKFMFVELLGQVVGIITYLLAVERILEVQGRQALFARYVSAYNWVMVPQILLLLLVYAVVMTGWLPESVALFLRNALSLALLIYPWFVARSVLEVSSLAALGYLVVDVAITLMVNGVIDSLYRVPVVG